MKTIPKRESSFTDDEKMIAYQTSFDYSSLILEEIQLCELLLQLLL